MRFTSRARFGSDNATCKRRECSIDTREEGVALRNHQTVYDTTLDGHDYSQRLLRKNCDGQLQRQSTTEYAGIDLNFRT